MVKLKTKKNNKRIKKQEWQQPWMDWISWFYFNEIINKNSNDGNFFFKW
jgi:hypothetical protein